MGPNRRPPLTTPEGCFLSNTVGSMFFLVASFVGAFVGTELGGEQGTLLGFVVFGMAAWIIPWRRWLVRWIRERQGASNDDTPSEF